MAGRALVRLRWYALDGDWRHVLDDPLRVPRAGTSTLMTWDFKRGVVIDGAAVGACVWEAVEHYGYYKANAREVTEASRVAAKRC